MRLAFLALLPATALADVPPPMGGCCDTASVSMLVLPVLLAAVFVRRR